MVERDYVGQQFGSRLVLKNSCVDEDWISIGKEVPKDKYRYSLCKCLNCGSIIPTDVGRIKRNPPNRCSICSNINNKYHIKSKMNTWHTDGDTATCDVLFNGKVIQFIVDAEDRELAEKYQWRIAVKRRKYYVVSGSFKKGTMIYLHQLILGTKEGYEIDHIDGESLNNKKSNLRFVTRQGNVDNQKATRIDNKLGIRGVSYDENSGYYLVDFSYHGKRYYVKPWKTLDEAVCCRYCLEKAFNLKIIENNPIAQKYLTLNEVQISSINDYVMLKIA